MRSEEVKKGPRTDSEKLELLRKASQIDINSAMSELLAVMHRDGGHYEEKVGKLQAIKDAQTLLHSEWVLKESLKAESQDRCSIIKDLEKELIKLSSNTRFKEIEFRKTIQDQEIKIKELESKLADAYEEGKALTKEVARLEKLSPKKEEPKGSN